MRFAYLLSFLATTALASPILSTKRDAASIVSSISTISSDITTLNSTLNTFNQGNLLNALTALKIQSQTEKVSDSLLAATSTAASSQPLNGDDSFKVAAAILDLQPKIFSLLDNLQSRKPVFDKAVLGLVGVSGQVLKSLQYQKQLSEAFGVTVAQKLAEPFKTFAPLIRGQISGAFDEAIATFSD
jgi:hypothetical protein